MDESVLRSMAKWPDVPAVYGWLALDRRGQWLIRGERIGNPGVSAFVGRNYACDEAGRWFFQNGPQRVFVDLDYTPWVLRIANAEDEPLVLRYHTGEPVAGVSGAWMDEDGMLLLETGRGVGLVHDRDLGCLSPYFTGADGNPLDDDVLEGLIDLLRSGNDAPLSLRIHGAILRVGPVRSVEVPARFGFVPRPLPPAGAEKQDP
jgi:hypothetical protein